MITSYSTFIKESTDIKLTPRDFGISDYIWNNAVVQGGLLDVKYGVDLDKKILKLNLTKIPFPFRKIENFFSCEHNNLTSLENSPIIVNDFFICSHNYLTSLKGCPKIVGNDFDCSNNRLTSLEYCPKEIGANFSCSFNQLKTLEHCPKIINENFFCDNNRLTSLEYCPKKVKGSFYCYNNLLTSIEDYPLCIIHGDVTNHYYFKKILEIVKDNEEIFENLLDDKIKFHQMVMRLDPKLIQYYKTIPPPKNNSKLLI